MENESYKGKARAELMTKREYMEMLINSDGNSLDKFVDIQEVFDFIDEIIIDTLKNVPYGKKVKLGKYIFIGNYVMPERTKYNFGVKEVVPEHGILKVLPNTILIKRTLRKMRREQEAQENGGE